MYLVDTNIWLERLLDQARSAEVGRFLAEIPSDQLLITDFTFHSIGLILTRLRRYEALLQFIDDVFVVGAVTLVSLPPEETERLIQVLTRFNLDFDDAYQYATAEINHLILVSFDADFDRTERRRLTPNQILNAR